MRVLGKTLYILFILILLGITGLFLATLLPIPLSFAGVPGDIEVKIVKSGSMEPTIMTGSIVLVVPQSSYAVGDIVTFGEDTARQIPTTHRIIATTPSGFQTKGDANEEADPQPIRDRDIIGRVVFWAPYAGYVLDFARQPIGFTAMIGIPAAVIVLDELFKIFAEVRRMRRKDKRDDTTDDDMGITYSFDDRYTTSQTTNRILDLRRAA